MSPEELQKFAQMGAAARLAELNQERAAILRAFPSLVGMEKESGPVGRARNVTQRKRRAMTAAERRAVSTRMKKYWAERRKAKAAKSA